MEQILETLKEMPRVILGTTIIYFFIVAAFRFIGKNGISELSLTDFVIILVISEAANSAIVGPSESILSSIVAISTLLFWDWLFRRLQLKFPRIDRAIEGDPLVLISRGKVLKKNLEKAEMNERKLAEALRKEGAEKFDDVKLAVMEPSGEITVIEFKPGEKG